MECGVEEDGNVWAAVDEVATRVGGREGGEDGENMPKIQSRESGRTTRRSLKTE